jgi:hypothetical protein
MKLDSAAFLPTMRAPMHSNYQYLSVRKALAALPHASILSNRPGVPARAFAGERDDDLN